MALDLFKPTHRTIQNPINLDVLANTYNTLEKGHQQAVATTAAYAAKLAELDLNEAEDAWRQQEIAKVRQALNDNMVYGNAAAALDDVVSTFGNITSNAGMIGRLRAQQDYKAYIDNLNKRTDISEVDKEYFRETNKYYYQDKTDNNGNVIGGTKWNPIDREVAAPNMPKMMESALKIAAKDAGGGNTIYYMAANGQLTTNPNASVDGLPYISKAGKYERLTQDKIKAAMDTVIANTPGALEGLRQDYKIANWRHDKNQSTNNDLVIDETTDDKGLKLSFDQYLQKRLQGFYHSASYSHYYGTDTPLAGMSVQAAKARQTAKGDGIDIGGYIKAATNTTPGNYYIEKTSAISATVGQSKAATEKLKGYANSLGVQFDLNDITGSYQKIVAKYNGVPPKEVYDTYKTYQTATARYEQLIPAGASDDFKAKLKFTTALEQKVDLSTLGDNKYAKAYIDELNKFWGNQDKRAFYVKGNIDDIIKNIDYKSLGLEIKADSEGNRYFEIGKEDAPNLYLIAVTFKPYVDDKVFNSPTTLGGISSIANATVRWALGNTGVVPRTIYQIFNQVDNLYKESAKTVDALMGEPANIPTETVSSMDVIQDMAERLVNTGKFSDYKAARDYAADELEASLHNAWGPRVNMAIGYGANPATYDVTSEQRFAAQQIARRARAKSKDLTSVGYDKNTLKTVINIALTPELKEDADIQKYLKDLGATDDNSITIIADNMFNNQAKNDVLSSPSWANSVDFTTAVNSGVHTFNLEDGNAIYTDGTNFEIESDGIRRSIDFNQAKIAVGANQKFNDLKYQYHSLIASGQSLTPEMIQAIDIYIKGVVAEYNPGIDVNSPSFAAKVNDLKYELFNSTLD